MNRREVMVLDVAELVVQVAGARRLPYSQTPPTRSSSPGPHDFATYVIVAGPHRDYLRYASPRCANHVPESSRSFAIEAVRKKMTQADEQRYRNCVEDAPGVRRF